MSANHITTTTTATTITSSTKAKPPTSAKRKTSQTRGQPSKRLAKLVPLQQPGEDSFGALDRTGAGFPLGGWGPTRTRPPESPDPQRPLAPGCGRDPQVGQLVELLEELLVELLVHLRGQISYLMDLHIQRHLPWLKDQYHPSSRHKFFLD